MNTVSAELLAWAMARAMANGGYFEAKEGKIWSNDARLIHFAQLTLDALMAHALSERVDG